MKKKHTLSDSEIRSAVGLFFQAPEIEKIEPLSLGVENSNYRVVVDNTPYAFRVYGFEHGYMGQRTVEDLEYELTFMKYMHRNGLPVPSLHQTTEGEDFSTLRTQDGDRFVSMVEFLEGEAPMNFTPDMAGQIGSVMAKMHVLAGSLDLRAKRNWPGSVIEMAEERYDKYKSHPNRQDSALSKRLDSICGSYEASRSAVDLQSLPVGPIHGDIIYHNLVFKGGRLNGIFDFDDCRPSHFLEDIVKSLQFYFDDPAKSIFGDSRNNYDAFLVQYETVRPLSAEEKNALPLFMNARVLYQLCRAFNDKWDGKRTQGFNVEQYLSRAERFSELFSR